MAKPILLLTATISPGGMINTARADPAQRTADYLAALTKWVDADDRDPRPTQLGNAAFRGNPVGVDRAKELAQPGRVALDVGCVAHSETLNEEPLSPACFRRVERSPEIDSDRTAGPGSRQQAT